MLPVKSVNNYFAGIAYRLSIPNFLFVKREADFQTAIKDIDKSVICLVVVEPSSDITAADADNINNYSHLLMFVVSPWDFGSVDKTDELNLSEKLQNKTSDILELMRRDKADHGSMNGHFTHHLDFNGIHVDPEYDYLGCLGYSVSMRFDQQGFLADSVFVPPVNDTGEVVVIYHGEPGPQGEKGEKGDRGLQGIQGLQGEKGDKGDDGAQGATGAKGDTGAQGEKGETGAQGPQGVAGATGAKGDTGAQGEKGETGAQGPQGVAGATGAKGDTGAQGEKGETGAQGPQGVAGATGAKGDTGAQGTQGVAGATGAKGDTGAQGLQGIQGATGEQGAQGPAGTNGTNGTNGTSAYILWNIT